VSSRVTMSVGFTAALVAAGVAVGTGAVKTPLSSSGSSSSATAPRAAILSTTAPAISQPSANDFSFALASVPASRHPKAAPSHSKKPKPTVTPTPSMAPSTTPPSSSTPTQQPVEGGGLTPQATAQNETPKGDNQKAWSEAILTSLGAPLTSANIISIGYWMQNEAGSPPSGIVGANNPINVSQSCCGGVGIQDDGDGVTFLQSYPTVADGVEAITQYLNRGNYTQILADLKAGAGLGGGDAASEISLYSGGGYSTIPDSWGSSQGQPEG
jgi:hypothetical protein